MIPIARNSIGESLPVLQPKTTLVQIVDGTLAHAPSSALPSGIYRIAVQSSVDSLGCHIAITTAGTGATITTGLFMGSGAIEYFALEEGSIVSVINGKINIVPCV